MSEDFVIQPTTLTVKNVLGEEARCYLIPDYQREYRWREEEQCETLWNDLTDQFRNNSNGNYYLGSVIVYSNDPNDGQGKRSCVIDGQQRLITLSLFLRQLFGKIYGKQLSQRQHSIYFCNNKETVKGGNPSWKIPEGTEHRIVSEVLGGEEEARLRYALDLTDKTNKPPKYGNSRYAKNSNFFEEKINGFFEEIEKDGGGEAANDRLVEFSDFVLNHIYLLLIKTNNQDDALTIFNTVNNRGMQLADGDIIKAALFKQAGKKDGEKFDKQWNEIFRSLSNNNDLGEDEETEETEIEKLLISEKDKQSSVMTELFRTYMHVLRAEKGIKSDIVGLRAFFIEGKDIGESRRSAKPDVHQDGSWHKIPKSGTLHWNKVVEDLKKLTAACQLVVSDKYPQLRNWLTALTTLGKRECLMPLLVWLFYNIETDRKGESSLPERKLVQGEQFFRDIVRLSFAHSFSREKVSSKLFEASVFAYKKAMLHFTPDNESEEKIKIGLNRERMPAKLGLGLVYILELLKNESLQNKSDDIKPYVIPLGQVEHILPQKTNNGNSKNWKPGEIDEAKYKLGNLVLILAEMNPALGNKSFEDKRGLYKLPEYKSKRNYMTTRALADLESYSHKSWKTRHEESKALISDFLLGTQSNQVSLVPIKKRKISIDKHVDAAKTSQSNKRG
jgi:uncharacterized protein with ParB-like and HNH nuclease domain